ncbi:glycerate kinase [Gordonia sp. NPDC003424]
MRVLVAPDKFKGSLTAHEVAACLSQGLSSVGHTTTDLPLADGGDGSVDAAMAAGFRRHPVTVTGADGAPRTGSVAIGGTTAVVEIANLCGLATLPSTALRPLDASSLGLGQALKYVLAEGVDTVVLALGGSASTDGGTGLLHALGYQFRDATGALVDPGGRHLSRIAAVTAEDAVDLAGVRIIIAGDVTNPLTGPHGAAHVYGPQKGADAEMVRHLDTGLAHLTAALAASGFPTAPTLAQQSGAGAAGGIGFGALLLGADMTSGADYFLDLLDIDHHLAAADLVITGEGSIDDQTEQGKLLGVLAERVRPLPLIAVAGRSTLPRSRWQKAGFTAIHTLGEHTGLPTVDNPDLTASVLTTIGQQIGLEYGANAHSTALSPTTA